MSGEHTLVPNRFDKYLAMELIVRLIAPFAPDQKAAMTEANKLYSVGFLAGICAMLESEEMPDKLTEVKITGRIMALMMAFAGTYGDNGTGLYGVRHVVEPGKKCPGCGEIHQPGTKPH